MGLLHRPDLISPFLYSGSILNLGLLMGALAAALLSREFAIRVAPVGELFKGGVGGLLMGLGANLAFGCNIGGFFRAVAWIQHGEVFYFLCSQVLRSWMAARSRYPHAAAAPPPAVFV